MSSKILQELTDGSFDPDISRLCRYSVISKSSDERGHYYTLHRQVKRHVLNRLTEQQLEQGCISVIRRLRQLFPRQSPFSGELDDKDPHCAPCIKHVLALRSAMAAVRVAASKPQVLASLYLDGGSYLYAKRLLADARVLTGEAERLCGTGQVDRSMTVQVYSFHASILSDSGNIERGREYFEKALVIVERYRATTREPATASDRALLANAYNNLGGIYLAMGDYERALRYNKRSLREKLEMANSGLPMSHLLCLSYLNLADTHAHQMRYDEAAECFGKAIEVATLEESKCRRALTNHNFGLMRLLQQNQVEQAQELFETAYQLRAEKLGDHPDTAASLHMLACCYHRMGDADSLSIAR